MNKDRLLSIGLPVHNGEKFLKTALESILRQSFDDFEVIVCDNNSIDKTQSICEEFVKRDERIKYHRNQYNIGAASNYNLTFELSKGKYFKWCAHDDILAPRMFEACVAALEKRPEAVLAYPDVLMVDWEGNVLSSYINRTDTSSPLPSLRYGSLLAFGNKCYEVFGLIRSRSLKSTGLIGKFAHSDGVLLAELALKGQFVNVPEPLIMMRSHPEQSMTMVKDYRKYTIWFDPTKKMPFIFPYWRMHYEFLAALRRARLPGNEKAECYRVLIRFVFERWKLLARELFFPVKYFFRTLAKSAE